MGHTLLWSVFLLRLFLSFEMDHTMSMKCVLMLLFSHSIMSDFLQLHRLQHTTLPCSLPSPEVCSNSHPLKSIRGQTEWKPQSQKTTNWSHGLQTCLTQWNYDPCCVGPPKTDGSWWRVLTKHGPLENRTTNHFSILALRIPWTVWKGKKIRNVCLCKQTQFLPIKKRRKEERKEMGWNFLKPCKTSHQKFKNTCELQAW